MATPPPPERVRTAHAVYASYLVENYYPSDRQFVETEARLAAAALPGNISTVRSPRALGTLTTEPSAYSDISQSKITIDTKTARSHVHRAANGALLVLAVLARDNISFLAMSMVSGGQVSDIPINYMMFHTASTMRISSCDTDDGGVVFVVTRWAHYKASWVIVNSTAFKIVLFPGPLLVPLGQILPVCLPADPALAFREDLYSEAIGPDLQLLIIGGRTPFELGEEPTGLACRRRSPFAVDSTGRLHVYFEGFIDIIDPTGRQPAASVPVSTPASPCGLAIDRHGHYVILACCDRLAIIQAMTSDGRVLRHREIDLLTSAPQDERRWNIQISARDEILFSDGNGGVWSLN